MYNSIFIISLESDKITAHSHTAAAEAALVTFFE